MRIFTIRLISMEIPKFLAFIVLFLILRLVLAIWSKEKWIKRITVLPKKDETVVNNTYIQNNYYLKKSEENREQKNYHQ